MGGWWLYLRFKPGATVKYSDSLYDDTSDSSPAVLPPKEKRFNKGFSKNKKDKKVE